MFYHQNYMLEQMRAMVFTAPAILLAIICHEYAHGFVSERIGDPTPRNSGRLTLNPLKHLDLWGTLCLLFFHAGWAKPVPINPYFYKNRKRGVILVSLAGPVTNFMVAFASVFIEGLLVRYGSRGSSVIAVLTLLAEYSERLNIGLGVFNLLPIPPLDGSKVLGELLPAVNNFYRRWEPYWRLALLLLLVTGILGRPLAAFDRTIFKAMWNSVVRILKLYLYMEGVPEMI